MMFSQASSDSFVVNGDIECPPSAEPDGLPLPADEAGEACRVVASIPETDLGKAVASQTPVGHLSEGGRE